MKRFALSSFLLFFAFAAVVTAPHTFVAQQNPASVPSSANAASTPDLSPGANGKLSQEQMQQLFRVVADKDMQNDKLLRNYTYIEREVNSRVNGKGEIKSTEERTYDILDIYGEPVQRLTQKDGKPLPEKEAAKEDEKIQKIIDKRKNETEDERRKREEKEQKEREQDREFARDVADAYNFTLVGTQTLNGREAWVIDGEPRPGFVPHAKDAKYLSKFHGRVWIDKSDLQLAKLDVECLDTISWGLFLARFHKGSRFMLEQTRVNDEVWLPQHLTAKVDARLALFKSLDENIEQTYSDYKKFRVTAKIVGIGDVKNQSPSQ
ncbi:MAG: hypothetical protein WA824_01175 [Candidatus Sulfotelmatobacter sp.]